MVPAETTNQISAQDAAQEVKVFRVTYEKTHTENACVYVPAKSKAMLVLGMMLPLSNSLFIAMA
jgi:hypothetical protein